METCEVLGVSFSEDYPDNIFSLNDWWKQDSFKPTLRLMTRCNKDDRSVVVYCVSLGGIIGHLPRSIANRLAPKIDSGVEYSVEDIELVCHDLDDEFIHPSMIISFKKDSQ
jgi:hypothetical protein